VGSSSWTRLWTEINSRFSRPEPCLRARSTRCGEDAGGTHGLVSRQRPAEARRPPRHRERRPSGRLRRPHRAGSSPPPAPGPGPRHGTQLRPALDLGHTDIIAHPSDKISSDGYDQADTPKPRRPKSGCSTRAVDGGAGAYDHQLPSCTGGCLDSAEVAHGRGASAHGARPIPSLPCVPAPAAAVTLRQAAFIARPTVTWSACGPCGHRRAGQPASPLPCAQRSGGCASSAASSSARLCGARRCSDPPRPSLPSRRVPLVPVEEGNLNDPATPAAVPSRAASRRPSRTCGSA
jgi:hypothetical protein